MGFPKMHQDARHSYTNPRRPKRSSFIRPWTTVARAKSSQHECHLFSDCGDCCQTLSGLHLVPLASDKATFTVDDLEREANRGASGRVSSPIPSRSRISAQWSAMVISRELNMGIPPAGFPDAVSMINTGPLSAVT